MVHGKTYRTAKDQRCVPAADVAEKEGETVLKSTGEALDTSWEKMSKSKYNGIDPQV